jgi:hypothetical protein
MNAHALVMLEVGCALTPPLSPRELTITHILD